MNATTHAPMSLYEGCRAATMTERGAAQDYGLIEDAAIVVSGDRLHWVGAREHLPADLRAQCGTPVDLGGALVTPGLIDCHTHLVYGGNRAGEFERRLNGVSYEEIARSGGGIASTVRETREADADSLLNSATRRLRSLVAEGVTTVEIKSGYGLSEAAERKCLRVAQLLGERLPVTVCKTFLGAHALPPEFAGRPDAYVDEVCRLMAVLHGEGLVDAVDAFCETIGFSRAQTARVFDAAKRLAIPVKLHAEQLSDSDGAALAASQGALSCDHLEWLSAQGAQAMGAAGTVAVLLPGAFYFLRETRVPPVALLREHGVPIAISTDCNPGSSPCTSLLLMLNMACTFFRMTPLEALTGVTRHAAKALGLQDRGQLSAGLRADFVAWDVQSPADLSYAIGFNPHRQTVYGGKLL